MINDLKLVLKYILLNQSAIFLKSNIKENEDNLVLINKKSFYFLITHLKLSSFFYATQLVEIFSYEMPINKNNKNKNSQLNSTLVYNFHSTTHQSRLFVFLNSSSNLTTFFKNQKKETSVKSTAELFLNANWLEREVLELNGIFFIGKKDVRNLMLQYGDTSNPFKKSYPCVGLREVYYDTITDNLINSPISLQF